MIRTPLVRGFARSALLCVVFFELISHVRGADGQKFRTDVSALGVCRRLDAGSNTNPRENVPLPVEDMPVLLGQMPITFEEMTIRGGESMPNNLPPYGIRKALRKAIGLMGLSGLVVYVGYLLGNTDVMREGNLYAIMRIMELYETINSGLTGTMVRRGFVLGSFLQNLVTREPWAVRKAILRLVVYMALEKFESPIQTLL